MEIDYAYNQVCREMSTEANDMDQFEKECMVSAPYIKAEEELKKECDKILKQIQDRNKIKKMQLDIRIEEKKETNVPENLVIERMREFRAPKMSTKEVKRKFE